MKAINPDCPTASVDGFARVTLPVSVSTKFWLVSKFSVTEPVFVVSVSVLPRCAAVKVLFSSFLTVSASCACTSVPITSPRLVLDADAVVAPVPPCATLSAVVSPDSDVMSELAPALAFALIVPILSATV